MRAFTTTPNTSMGRAWRMQAHRKLPDPSSPLCMAYLYVAVRMPAKSISSRFHDGYGP
jgi:hypothetical protein